MDSTDPVPEPPVSAVPEEPRGQWSALSRVACLLAGVVMPVVCFVMVRGLSAEWQSGEASAYALALLSWRPASAFYPLLLYAMTSMTLLVVSFDRAARFFLVRLGAYSGVLLACQYFAIALVAAPGLTTTGTILALVLWGCEATYACIVREVGYVRPGKESPVVRPGAVMAIVLVPIVTFGGLFLMAVPCLAPVVPALGPVWALIAYSAVAYRVVNERHVGRWQFSLAQLMGTMAWFAAWLGAWRVSLRLMFEEYDRLPMSKPGCYVATAAARGHRRWVGSEEVIGPAGELCRINDQLRYLKAFELVWARVAPRGHRACRRCYDRLGPIAAAMLVHPLLADAAYAALKPAEWTARIVLAVLVPGGGDDV